MLGMSSIIMGQVHARGADLAGGALIIIFAISLLVMPLAGLLRVRAMNCENEDEKSRLRRKSDAVYEWGFAYMAGMMCSVSIIGVCIPIITGPDA